MNVRLVLTLVLAGLVVLFVLQYAVVVEVRYLLWKIEMARALLIFIVFAVGILTGWLLRAHFHRGRPES